MSVLRKTHLLPLLAALLIGSAVWITSALQTNAANDAREREAAARTLLTAMLDMQTAVRGFELHGTEPYAAPFVVARREFDAALIALRADLDGATAALAGRVGEMAHRWQTEGEKVLARVRLEGKRAVPGAKRRKALFDAFRTTQGRLVTRLVTERESAARTSAYTAAAVSLLLALGIAFLGDLLVGRRDRADRRRQAEDSRYRASQSEFVETMQLAEDEAEAHSLLRRHIERSLPESDVVIFNRNNSHDRLEPATRVDDPALAERLEGAHPKSCLAVRLGREHRREPGGSALMSCELCGKTEDASTCRPLLVGTEVIGSVLVTHHGPVQDSDRERLRTSVAQAAPTLANLRNLTLAEKRAATDALTGLPNRRSIEDTLKRMIAQASRSASPLSALMLDLDHFKTINDLYGHEAGDDVLAAVGALLGDTLREADFAGRQGGEEFIVLAPGTDAVGAEQLAENLRAAVESLQVAGLDHRLSVSIGVATFPDLAAGATGLVRMADRALYAAKERGRNRVEVASGPGTSRAT